MKLTKNIEEDIFIYTKINTTTKTLNTFEQKITLNRFQVSVN